MTTYEAVKPWSESIGSLMVNGQRHMHYVTDEPLKMGHA